MMNDQALIQFLRQAIPDLVALYRFGSQAKGGTRPDSDVDLVDLRAASTVMRMQVISTGECLDSPNGPARREFEMYVYSDYARLNEERREILKRVRTSGVIYG